LKGVAMPFKGPALRVWLPSRRRQPLCLWKPFSAPHAHGLRSSELSSGHVARQQFPAAVPPLRFPAKPKGLTATLRRFPHTKPAVHPAPVLVLKTGWSHCSPELLHLSGVSSPGMGRSACPLPAPLTLSSLTSENAKDRSPRGFLPTKPRLPSFEGREPVWRS
jgi:hypothetical protein